MKIAIIGTARSRTTILFHSIAKQHPNLSCLFEFFSYRLQKNLPFIEIADSLSIMDNYIVKILGHNLFPSEATIEHFHFEQYNHIYMIERPDFFNQCCSLQFSSDNNVWHLYAGNEDKYQELSKIPIELKLYKILYQARGVQKQIEIKKYLIQNNIDFVLNDYNDPLFDNLDNLTVVDTKLNYEDIITNYNCKDLIESLFNKHFNYNALANDFESFKQELISFLSDYPSLTD